MLKHFYSFIIDTESLYLEIEALDIEEEEKSHLKSLAESHIHHSVIDNILSELETGDKRLFLEHLNTKDHEKIWKFLHSKIDSVEEKIKEAANSIKKELHKDIREANQEN